MATKTTTRQSVMQAVKAHAVVTTPRTLLAGCYPNAP